MECIPCIDHPFTPTKRLSAFEIIIKACSVLELKSHHVIGKRRDKELTEARHMIFDMLHNNAYLRMTLCAIGKEFSGRDHATIINGIKNVTKFCKIYPEYRSKYMDLHLKVYGNLNYFNH